MKGFMVSVTGPEAACLDEGAAWFPQPAVTAAVSPKATSRAVHFCKVVCGMSFCIFPGSGKVKKVFLISIGNIRFAEHKGKRQKNAVPVKFFPGKHGDFVFNTAFA